MVWLLLTIYSYRIQIFLLSGIEVVQKRVDKLRVELDDLLPIKPIGEFVYVPNGGVGADDAEELWKITKAVVDLNTQGKPEWKVGPTTTPFSSQVKSRVSKFYVLAMVCSTQTGACSYYSRSMCVCSYRIMKSVFF